MAGRSETATIAMPRPIAGTVLGRASDAPDRLAQYALDKEHPLPARPRPLRVDLYAEVPRQPAAAAAMAERIAELERANARLSAGLDAIDRAILFLDADGCAIHANRRGRALLAAGDTLTTVAGRIVAVDPAARLAFDTLVGAATAPRSGSPIGGTIALRAAGRPIAVGIVPIDPAGDPDGACAMLCLGTADAPPPPLLLIQAYDLTLAEARVTIALLDGCTAKTAAARLGTSIQTIRNQISRVFEKTGTARQSELIRLLAPLTTATR